jgi:hypothetical protein
MMLSNFGIDVTPEQLEKQAVQDMKMFALQIVTQAHPEGCSVKHLIRDADEIMGWLNK